MFLRGGCNFNNRKALCKTCEHCRDVFETVVPNAKVCKKRECIDYMKRKHYQRMHAKRVAKRDARKKK